MKVGDYVRFKTLSREIKIGKVIDIIEPDKDSMKKYCVYDLDNNEATVDDYIIKSSSNLTDLIEVGDIAVVSGVKYTIVRADDMFDGRLFIQKIGHYPSFTTIKYLIEKKQLQAIVTKEMFESMEYKIGE